MGEIAKFGRLRLLRPDQWNWEIDDGEISRYYATLPSAMCAVVRMVADRFSKEPWEWLEAYRQESRRMEKLGQRFVERIRLRESELHSPSREPKPNKTRALGRISSRKSR